MRLKSACFAVTILLMAPSMFGQGYAIRNARIVTVSGADIDRGTVVIKDGKIAAVGKSVRIPRGTRRIDGRGLTVYPGLFNANTNVGLTEIGAVPVSSDFSEIGDYTPQLRAWSAIHVESEHIPVARVDGLTHVVTRPTGGTISGQGAIVHLDGWNQEEMEIERSGAMYLNLPAVMRVRPARFGGFRGRGGSYKDAQKRYDEQVAELKELFARVRAYSESDKSPRDRQLEALIPVVEGKLLVVMQANSHVDIKNASLFGKENGLKFAILGASDAWMVADYLKENDVSVILGPVQSLPGRNDDPIDIVYRSPSILQEKGVRFAMSTGGAANARTLPFEVGNAVAHGLSWEAALRSITLTPAEIFGVDDRLGSIDEGKIANLVVTDGDIFEYQTEIKHLFIRGKEVSLESKHTELYRKYLNRP